MTVPLKKERTTAAMAKRSKRVKHGDPSNRHPYMKYEGTPMWKWVSKALRDLVKNQDLIEKEDPRYTVGYICKTITDGQRRARVTKRVTSK
jgi:hypothetical protein